MLGPDGDWAFAVLRVTGVDRPADPSAAYDGCRVSGVLVFDLRPAEPVQGQYLRVPTAKWLRPDDEVPVVVRLSYLAARRAGAVSVLWDKLPERAALQASSAGDLAAQLRGAHAQPAAGDRYRAGSIDDPTAVTGLAGRRRHGAQAEALLLQRRAGDRGRAVGRGRQGAAAVARSVPVGATIADLTLRVTPPDGEAYDVRTRIGFSNPHRRSVVAQMGATLPVRIDPADPVKVAVDTVALGFAQTAAGAGGAQPPSGTAMVGFMLSR